MMWCKSCLLLVLCCIVCSQKTEVSQEKLTENEREVRQYDFENWKAVEHYPQDTSGWIPRDQSIEQQRPKRRRIRKRKRRPQNFSTTDASSEDNFSHPNRRSRPQRLDQFQEPWEEMTEEMIRGSNHRRRIIPVYSDSNESGSPDSLNISPISSSITLEEETVENVSPVAFKITPEKIRDPFTALEEAESKQKPTPNESRVQTVSEPSTTTQNLKTILKQNNGELSLSEILQQKNLTLSELLMGNKNALSALTQKVEHTSNEPKFIPDESTSTEVASKMTKYKRLPPSVGLRKRISEQDRNSHESLSSGETLEAQRRRLALLHAHKDNKIYSAVTKYEVVTEPMTENRIFVPSHPKYYTSLDYVSDFLQKEIQNTDNKEKNTEQNSYPNEEKSTEKIRVSTTRKPFTKPKPKPSLPITNAKLHKVIQNSIINKYSSPKTTTIPEKAFKIDFDNLFGLHQKDNTIESLKEIPPIETKTSEISVETSTKHVTVKKDEPLKMVIDLEPMEHKPVKITAQSEQLPIKIKANVEENSTKNPTVEKVKQVTAKEEIMEILKDPISRDRLSRILAMRNMTVEELVAQRERGSSQLHLADIFHNETREPEPQGEPFIGHINPPSFDTFPKTARQQKSRPLDNLFEESSPVPKIEPKPNNNQEETKKEADMIAPELQKAEESLKPESETPRSLYTITSFPTYKIESDKNGAHDQNQPFLPFWRELYPDIFSEVHENSDQKRPEATIKPTIITDDFINLQRLDDVDNKLSRIKSETFNVDVSQDSFSSSAEQEDFIALPSGVKSAIIASLIIIGLSLLVFVTILVVFKYSQKQKQRLCYRNSFSGSKIKSPILETEQQKRTLRTFMTETLGRRKDLYKQRVQSMSDGIWETEKRPF